MGKSSRSYMISNGMVLLRGLRGLYMFRNMEFVQDTSIDPFLEAFYFLKCREGVF